MNAITLLTSRFFDRRVSVDMQRGHGKAPGLTISSIMLQPYSDTNASSVGSRSRRDRIFRHDFVEQVRAMGIKQVLSATRSPWQRAYIERVIGTIRHECLDYVMMFNERSLHQHLQAFTTYYHRSRTHLGLQKDTPEPRPVQPPEARPVISIREVGRLHDRYERRAA
jgi:hypothetical protein